MRIEHVGLWASDIERDAAFYEKYFGARVGAPYRNPRTTVPDGLLPDSGPRRTGDGYYECVVRDPEGNRVEIAA